MGTRRHDVREAASIGTSRGAVLEVQTIAAGKQRPTITDSAVPAESRRYAPPVRMGADVAPGETAFLLTDLHWKPVYHNDAAALVLLYPATTSDPAALQERVRAIFQADRFTAELPPTSFLSGRRHYVCRAFLVESQSPSPMVAVLMERCPRRDVELSDVSRRFHLSRRESETVQYLSRGLTTKEVAQRMSVSPNTVKQFVRLIMSKMSVTTRSGIVGKLLGR
jgi:DNA-binding CsgD family transcriptional regulator